MLDTATATAINTSFSTVFDSIKTFATGPILVGGVGVLVVGMVIAIGFKLSKKYSKNVAH